MLSRYLCVVLGQDRQSTMHMHPITLRRLRAWGLSLHVPVLLWAGTSYLLCAHIFGLAWPPCTVAAVASGGLIYLLERVILLSPKTIPMALVRALIGGLAAVIGACSVDLVIFEREILQELRAVSEARLHGQHAIAKAELDAEIRQQEERWEKARERATCEGDGTCGSRLRSPGPLYRELVNHADQLRRDYLKGVERREALHTKFTGDLNALKTERVALQAGLLARINALHGYVQRNFAALCVWLVFFSLILLLELSVVIAKFAFGESVDDVFEKVRERVGRHQAQSYLESVMSPLTRPRQLLHTELGR